MQYKRFSIECNKNYFARVYRCPDLFEFDLFDFTLHWHRDYEIVYIHSGSITIQKIDTKVTLKTGDVYFINSEEVHSYSIEDRDNLQFILINFPVRAVLPYFANPCEVACFSIDSQEAKTKITDSLKRLMTCKDFNNRLDVLRVKAVLNDVSYYLLRDCKVNDMQYFRGGSDSDDFICAKSAVHYMEQNYRNNITLEEISSYVGMAPAHFSKYFKDKIDLTFTQYLRKIRLEHAVNDVILNNATVKEAALNNGFPNVNSFINSCKNEFGKTPMELKLYNSEQS